MISNDSESDVAPVESSGPNLMLIIIVAVIIIAIVVLIIVLVVVKKKTKNEKDPSEKYKVDEIEVKDDPTSKPENKAQKTAAGTKQ